MIPLTILESGKDWAELDSSPVQHFIASEGVFLKRSTVLGKGIVQYSSGISGLAKLGEGEFIWEQKKIPKEICAQIVDFFIRIYNKHKTEAQVLLTFDPKADEWGVFVPKQKVSHGNVKWEDDDLPSNVLLVGTMHSHADFSAFHSGTDIEDANNFDGVHFTIGHVDKNQIQIDTIVSLNKTIFKGYTWEDLADFTDLGAAKAPSEWDDKVSLIQYEFPKTKGNWWYGKKDKPSYPPSEYKSLQVYDWDSNVPYDLEDDEEYLWISAWRNLVKTGTSDSERKESAEVSDLIIDALFDSDLITGDDIDDAVVADSAHSFWVGRLNSKISDIRKVLNLLGVETTFTIKHGG